MSKQVKAKQSAVRHDATVKVAKFKPEQFKGIGRLLVATALRADATVLDALLETMGKTPQELESIKEGVREAWTKHRVSLGIDEEKVQSEKTMQMMVQATYNRQSEMLACLNAFKLYAGMDVDTAAEFKQGIADCHGYHKVVEYCRHVVRATKGEPLTVAEIEKKKKAKGELTAGTVKSIEKNLKLASMEQLLEIREAIAKRIAMLKPKQADVVSITKNRKARKAVSKKAAAAFKAVNRRAA